LSQIPALHQRTKVAIYCSNARISYLLRAIPLDLSLALMPSLDTSFDSFIAVTINFEPASAQSPAAVQYSKEFLQLRLCIQDGGIGLMSAALVAPAASSVALCEFLNWYCPNATLWGGLALQRLSWHSDGTSAAHAFPSISHNFDQAVNTLTKWRFHGSLADTTKQTVIAQLMKEQTSREF
jgi:hypothetical protein